LESKWRLNVALTGNGSGPSIWHDFAATFNFAARLDVPLVPSGEVYPWLMGYAFLNGTLMTFGRASVPGNAVDTFEGYGGFGSFPGIWAVEPDN